MLFNSTINTSLFFAILIQFPSLGEARTFVSSEVNTSPSPNSFSICYNHSCKNVQQLTITEADWSTITRLFAPAAQTAIQERALIAKAIAKLEKLVGPMTGTDNDKGYNLDGLMANGNQMDCIDESTNTNTYLTMLEKGRQLKWHQVQDPVTRGFFIFGWPHTTAVIRVKNTKQDWAVDSWFYDNGKEPTIVPLEKWKDGWDPHKQSRLYQRFAGYTG